MVSDISWFYFSTERLNASARYYGGTNRHTLYQRMLSSLDDSMTSLSPDIDQHVTMRGTALEAKGGPVIRTHNNQILCLPSFPAWPDDVINHHVEVSGIIRYQPFLPPGGQDAIGAYVSGAHCSQYLLENPSWHPL